MLILHVGIHVKPEYLAEFRKATLKNAKNSVNEPGIERFDVLQHSEDPNRFALWEVYYSQEAVAAHKLTAHYAIWTEVVEKMMAEPRTRTGTRASISPIAMRFEFASAGRIVFGPGTVRELSAIAAAYSRRAFIVIGKDKIRHAGLISHLESVGFHCTLFGVPREPDMALVREGAASLRAAESGVVIGIGGGSAIDAGKAIAALAANPGDVQDYLEVIGKGQPLMHAPVPFVAVPTTAGTGSEVTRNAVIGSPEHGVKASLRSPLMLPRVAIVDPELTLALPRAITLSSGLDALTQLIEPFVCNRANPMVDALCRDGLRVVARCLPRVCANGRDAEARAGMSYASLLGGLALSNAGLGVVHGFAAPIGGMFNAPHGSICAALLPHSMEANVRALKARAPESEALGRYEEIAKILRDFEWMATPGLGHYGVTTDRLPEIAEKAERASSMKANPVVLTRDELVAILAAAI